MKKPTRPKWARKLTPRMWKHLQEGQARPNPTLSGLKLDAQGPCTQCEAILKVVQNA